MGCLSRISAGTGRGAASILVFFKGGDSSAVIVADELCVVVIGAEAAG